MSKARGEFAGLTNPPLPPCRGPKLHEFKHASYPIKWLKRLDEDRTDNEGFVFQVEIKSKEYALKVVSKPRTTFERL